MNEHTNPHISSDAHLRAIAGKHVKMFRHREEVIQGLVDGKLRGFYITAPLKAGEARVIIAEFDFTKKTTSCDCVVGWDYLRKMDLGPIVNDHADLNAVTLEVIDHFESQYGMRNNENQATNLWYHGYW